MAEKPKFKRPEYVYFVFTKGSNAGYGFSTYVDKVGALGTPGAIVSISYQLDKANQPIPYVFSMSVRDRALKVEKDKVDMKGISVVDFLRNSPECKDSPNGEYLEDGTQVNVWFKELNEESDAEIALKAKEYRRKAENIAADLSYDDVIDMNAFLGYFETKELMARHYLMELAGNRPQVFMKAYEDPNRKALALIRKGIARNVLGQNGNVITWNKTTLGLDELEAASAIQKDQKLLSSLTKAVEQAALA
jgi:hypothetical protein